MDDAEAAAIAQEIFDLQVLTGHDGDVVVEPGAIDRGEARVVERLDVHPMDLGTDLRPQASNFDHGVSSTRWRISPP